METEVNGGTVYEKLKLLKNYSVLEKIVCVVLCLRLQLLTMNQDFMERRDSV